MVIDVWSWDANPGKAWEATQWCVAAAKPFSSIGDATAKVLRPKNGEMMKVYLVTEHETQAGLDECWSKFGSTEEFGEMMKVHADLFNQDTSLRYQYDEMK
jgi:hypothetical protein